MEVSLAMYKEIFAMPALEPCFVRLSFSQRFLRHIFPHESQEDCDGFLYPPWKCFEHLLGIRLGTDSVFTPLQTDRDTQLLGKHAAHPFDILHNAFGLWRIKNERGK
jgi:hypothetical protein